MGRFIQGARAYLVDRVKEAKDVVSTKRSIAGLV